MREYHNQHLIHDLTQQFFAEYLNGVKGLTEIAVNEPNKLFLKVKGRWEKREPKISYDDCLSFASTLADYHSDSIGDIKPVLSATLPHGERVQVVIPPACEKDKVSITIRKPSNVFITHDDIVKSGFYSRVGQSFKSEDASSDLVDLYHTGNFAAFIPECLRQGKTMVFCGGTGSGKTTFSNAVMFYIPHHLRLISIEDTDETRFRFHENHVKLYYPSEGGNNLITSASLLRACLRMNPDRILMTEIRGAETWDFLKASSSGHSGGVTTVHEEKPEDAILGMVTRCYQNTECNNLPFNALVRKVLNNIDVIMSIKYLSDVDKRFASDIYFKDVHQNDYLARLLG
ncbi:P-type DNA transfer ATPase VirB11 [Providencia alcalifaciens]|uniref:P-type DNA transfer ATPase VirB11 n=1 Tax=Providencia alcalifaciens TaxID=126385 RepID=UPI0012B58F41|nr:P-type DNA transfer ATPase VirB11 [Providencia alcalifaciens]MTC25122.1 P-type DNA transfer ATPase VirB11 [Providencia alcalifaciens]MTC61822.1 P-type DNA transfer ATPase VirB11 [Providencia alcalifaciens]